MDLDDGDRVIARVLESGRYGEGSNKPDSKKKEKNKMKKLMIAALATVAVAGAYAACDYVAPDTAWVYKWTFSGKTTVGTPVTATVVKNACGYNGSTGAAGACGLAVRVPASLKIEGYTWVCKPGCGSDAFEQFVEINEIFWQTKPFKASMSGGVSTCVSNIIGKKAKQFEAAGLGKYDAKNGRVTSVSGNFAGFLDQPYYIGKIGTTYCPPAGFWDCVTGALTCGPSVAYGKWSAKYMSSASKKYLKYGTLPSVPSWVRHLNAL